MKMIYLLLITSGIIIFGLGIFYIGKPEFTIKAIKQAEKIIQLDLFYGKENKDNKTYDPLKKEVTYKEKGTNKTLIKAGLISETHVSVIDIGNEKQKVFDVRIRELDINKSLKEIFTKQKLIREKDGKEITNREVEYRLRKEVGNYTYPVQNSYCNGTYQREIFDDETNLTVFQEEPSCYTIVKKHNNVEIYDYLPISSTSDLPATPFVVSVFVDIHQGETVDWIPSFYDDSNTVEEWAKWTENLNTNIKAYYNMNGSIGTTVRDYVDRGGTASQPDGLFNASFSLSAVESTGGIIGNSTQFGVSSNSRMTMKTTEPTMFNVSSNVTISFWVNLTVNTTDNRFIWTARDSWDANPECFFRIETSPKKTMRVQCFSESTGNPAVNQFQFLTNATNFSYSTGVYRHYVIQWTNDSTGNATFWVNNVIIGNDDDVKMNMSRMTTEDHTFGDTVTLFGFSFVGHIDELGWWDRYLTAEEIASLYNSNRGITYNPNPYLTVNAPLDNQTFYNILNTTLNITTFAGFNNTVWYCFHDAITGFCDSKTYIMCSGGVSCAENQTNITFPRQGLFNLTVFANNSIDERQSVTIRNLFVGNYTLYNFNATYQNVSIFAYVNQSWLDSLGNSFPHPPDDGNLSYIINVAWNDTTANSRLDSRDNLKLTGGSISPPIMQRYVVTIENSLNISSINRMNWTWEGSNQFDSIATNISFYSWNFTNGSWKGTGGSIYCAPFVNSQSDVNRTCLINSSVTDFINSTTRNTTILLAQGRFGLSDEIRTDYIALEVVASNQNTPPKIYLILPTNDSTLTVSKTNLTYNITDDDDIVVNASLFFDNIRNQTVGNPNPYGTGLNFSLSGISDGVHTWIVNACDTDNVCVNSSAFTFTIGSTPCIEFVYPTPANATITSNGSVIFNVSMCNKAANYINGSQWNFENFTQGVDGEGENNISIMTNQLVLMMNMNNVTALAENDTLVFDISQGKNNGTAKDGVKVNTTNCKYNYCMTFDGVNDFVNIADDTDLRLENFTVSAWIYPRSQAGDKIIIQKDELGIAEALNDENYFLQVGLNNSVEVGYGNLLELDQLHIQDPLNISNFQNTWVHYTGTYNSSNLVLYRNGKRVATSTTITSLPNKNTEVLKIGGSNTTGFFNGNIDEPRVWNIALNDTEVYINYASNLNKHNLTQWYFIINQSKNASDLLDNGNYTYFARVIAQDGDDNMTDIRTIKIGNASTDSCGCPSVNNNWNVSMQDYCVINSACNLGRGNLTFYNSGNFTCAANINASNIGNIPSNSIFYVNNQCLLKVTNT